MSDFYVVIGLRKVAFSESKEGHSGYRKPVLWAKSSDGHNFYVQWSKNSRKIDDARIASLIAQCAFDNKIPQAKLSFARTAHKSVRKKKIGDMVQSLLPF